MKTVTQWFGMEKKPVRIGVYQMKDTDSSPSFSHWNGEFFGLIDTTLDGAFVARYMKSLCIYEDISEITGWRGLAAKAKP